MKRSAKLWFGVAAIAVIGLGASWVTVTRVSAEGSSLVVLPEAADLGTVKRLSGVVTRTFTVRNAGATPVTITRITTS